MQRSARKRSSRQGSCQAGTGRSLLHAPRLPALELKRRQVPDLTALERGDRQRLDPALHNNPCIIQCRAQVLGHAPVLLHSDRDVRNVGDLEAKMRLQGTLIQGIVQKRECAVALVRYETHVSAVVIMTGTQHCVSTGKLDRSATATDRLDVAKIRGPRNRRTTEDHREMSLYVAVSEIVPPAERLDEPGIRCAERRVGQCEKFD